MIAWRMAGRRPDYRDVVAPFPPEPLPCSESGWCDEAALRHYAQAMADPGSHFATVEFYGSGLPMHRMRSAENGRIEFDYIEVHGAQKHPDLAQPLCYGSEDWKKKFENPALFVYSPVIVPDAFGAEGWNASDAPRHDLWQQSSVRSFPRLETIGIGCGHA